MLPHRSVSKKFDRLYVCTRVLSLHLMPPQAHAAKLNAGDPNGPNVQDWNVAHAAGGPNSLGVWDRAVETVAGGRNARNVRVQNVLDHGAAAALSAFNGNGAVAENIVVGWMESRSANGW